jgi:hypothetical protein
MRNHYATPIVALLLAFAAAPRLLIGQTSSDKAAQPSEALQFESGDARSHMATWFARMPTAGLESTIRQVVTPVTTKGVRQIEVYTDIEVRRNKELIRRISEKRVFNGPDMRPVSTRTDVELHQGAAIQNASRELKYDQQRVKGQSIEPGNAPRLIEKELPAGLLTVPGVALAFLQESLVAPGRTLTFITYNELTDAVEDAQIRIDKREEIKVAGQTYDAWKVEIKTGRTTATAHYTTTIPRVLLRLKDNQQFQELVEISK